MPAVDIYGRPWQGQWHEEDGPDPAVEALAEAMSQLTPERRALLYAVKLKGLSMREYARMTGVNESSVRRQMKRTLVTLKRMMDGSSPDTQG